MTCNEFKQSMEEQFGKMEWRATSGNKIYTSSGWPTNPSHPANADESSFIFSLVRAHE